MAEEMKMFINNQWIDDHFLERTSVINPATEEIVALVPNAGIKEASFAVESAKEAQRKWAKLPIVERATYLKKIAKRIEKSKERLAEIIVKEQGKPFIEALDEVDGCIFQLDYAANWALRIEGDLLESEKKDEQIIIKKVPHGVVLAVTPWNYPLTVPARKIGPALITGNTVILKPHELTPLSALELARLFELEGIPKGVLNVVTGLGEEVGSYLTKHEDIDFITVTGSVRAGRAIYTSAANNITPVSLELGGKAPFIVMDDVDIDKVVEHAVESRMTNCGQICICNERTYIHENIYDEFVSKYVEAVSKIKIGDPMDLNTQLGPKANGNELNKVDKMVKEAQAEGARILIGGSPLSDGEFEKGFWYPPTVLVDVEQDMAIIQDEVFGPVTPIMKFSNIEEAINLANDSKFGLSSYLFTNNYKTVMKTIQDMDFGEIFINRSGGESFHAYHSGYRNSGVGGDDGKYGIESYLKKKAIYLNYSD